MINNFILGPTVIDLEMFFFFHFYFSRWICEISDLRGEGSYRILWVFVTARDPFHIYIFQKISRPSFEKKHLQKRQKSITIFLCLHVVVVVVFKLLVASKVGLSNDPRQRRLECTNTPRGLI